MITLNEHELADLDPRPVSAIMADLRTLLGSDLDPPGPVTP